MSLIFASSKYELFLCSISKIYRNYAISYKILYANSFPSSFFVQLKKIYIQVIFEKYCIFYLQIILNILKIIKNINKDQNIIYEEHS